MAEHGQATVTSTGRICGRQLEPGELSATKSETQMITPAPPPLPGKTPGPFGDLSGTPMEEIADLSEVTPRPVAKSTISNRRHGTRMLLQHLEGFDGSTWQDRWETAGLNERDRPVSALADQDRTRQLLVQGMRMLFQWRVVRPSITAVHANHLVGYADAFRQMQRDRCWMSSSTSSRPAVRATSPSWPPSSTSRQP